MKAVKKVLNDIFVEGMGGMALGLFATLIVGTIIKQVGNLVGGDIGSYLIIIGSVAASATGAGIGCGVAFKYKTSPLVMISAAVSGMIGAFAGTIIATFAEAGVSSAVTIAFGKPGEPLGAFVAALVAIYIGKLISGKTPIDILITPFVAIVSGATVGLVAGPPISSFMTWLGSLINWGTEQAPFLMGIILSVLMGIILTLPISSAALSISLQLSGIAAGAAVVGCAANMIGFAVASYRDNKFNGLLAQGLGTSMLQIGNIVKKPIIWLPAIVASAILGPISTVVFQMENNAMGAGMGTSGLVGQINAYTTMTESGQSSLYTIILIVGMHIVLPAIISLAVSEWMRKKKWIKPGDMKLNA